MKDYSRVARKIPTLPFVVQSLCSAGFIAAFTINAIVGADLSGQAAWAGVPSATYTLGGALAAFAWGFTMERVGRRNGLAMGQLLGVLGAAIAAPATVAPSSRSR